MLTRCPNCFQEYEDQLGLCPHCGFAPGDLSQEPKALTPGSILAGRFAVGAVHKMTTREILYNAWDQTNNQRVVLWEYFPDGLAERTSDGVFVQAATSQNKKKFTQSKLLYSSQGHFLGKLGKMPGLLPILDHFSTNGTEYRVTPQVEGTLLAQRLSTEGAVIPPEQFAKAGIEICEVFDAIHRGGAIVSNLSPESFLISREGSLLYVGLDDLVLPGTATPLMKSRSLYSPPEEKVNVEGNIYSLGAVFYHLLTRLAPQCAAERLAGDQLLPPSGVDQSIPPNISLAIMTAMSLEPSNRFPSAIEFAQALKQPEDSPEIEDSHRETAVPLSPFSYRSLFPLLMGVTCFVVVALVVLGIWYVVSNQSPVEVAPSSSETSSSMVVSQAPASSSSEILVRATATPQATATPTPSPTPEPEPEQVDSVNYQIQRQDRSVYDDNGEPVLQFYYDLVVLEVSSDAVTQINDALAQECQTFLETNQQSVDDTIAQFNPGANSGFTNVMSGQVVHNGDGIISIVHSLNWMMGGVHNLNYTGMTFDLNTGERLTLSSLYPDIPRDSVTEFVKSKVVQYIIDRRDDGWLDNAEDVIAGYDIDNINFCVDHGEIILFFPTYELKAGMAGPVSISLNLPYPQAAQSDLTTVLAAGADGNGAAWCYLDDGTSPQRGVDVSIGMLYLREDGTCSFVMGFYMADGLGSQSGTYALSGNTLSLNLRDDATGQEARYEYQAILFGDAVVLTQLSENGLFHNYPQGSVLALYDVFSYQG